jgi:CheY-like chemotaxis protein
MPGGGELVIETSNVYLDKDFATVHPDVVPGLYVMLSIRDSGTGMDGKTLSRIFEPFFTTKTADAASGLGLPTVFGIVRQSNGHIAVTSEPGQGTEVKIYVPAAEAPVPDPGTRRQEEPGPAGGDETILFVEDDEGVRNYAYSILTQRGYKVLRAPDGHEALSLAASHRDPIHLLLTDVVLPKMGGREVAEALTSKRPDLKVAYISGYGADAIAHRGLLDPGVQHLAKPFSPKALERTVRRALDSPKPRPSVIVVDDDSQIRELLSDTLRLAGYSVRTGSSGAEAIQLYREAPSGLMILDLVMPGQEGIETIQLLRQEFPSIRIMAISGAMGGAFLNSAKLLGAQAVLQKPVQPSDLVRAVKRLVG